MTAGVCGMAAPVGAFETVVVRPAQRTRLLVEIPYSWSPAQREAFRVAWSHARNHERGAFLIPGTPP